METQLPLQLELHLIEMGLFSKEHEELDDPVHDPYQRHIVSFDENGEPDF